MKTLGSMAYGRVKRRAFHLFWFRQHTAEIPNTSPSQLSVTYKWCPAASKPWDTTEREGPTPAVQGHITKWHQLSALEGGRTWRRNLSKELLLDMHDSFLMDCTYVSLDIKNLHNIKNSYRRNQNDNDYVLESNFTS